MKKLISLMLALTLLLSLCACAFAEEAEDSMAAYRTGFPWVCVDLDGVVTGDMDYSAKDHFAFFVNQDFYRNGEIPAGYVSSGVLSDVAMFCDEELLALLQTDEEAASEDGQLAQTLYGLFMDWDARNALGMEPVMGQIQIVDALTTVEGLNRYLLETELVDVMNPFFDTDMTVDFINPDIYVPYVDYISVMLDDPAEYTERTDLGQLYYDSKHFVVLALLEKCGYTPEEAEKKFDNAYRFEEMLAPKMLTSEEELSPDYMSKILNYMSRDELLELQGNVPMVQFLEDQLGYGTQENWLVTVPDYFAYAQEWYVDENIEMITDWMIVSYLRSMAGYLDQECYDLIQEYRTMVRGTEPLPVELNTLYEIESLLPWQLSRLYCEAYFTQAEKDEITEQIHSFVDGYKAILENTDFITEETKTAALRKLDNLIVRCLYPDDWSEYTGGITFAEGGSLMDALNAITEATMERSREEVKKPVDHTLWSAGIPIEVNAFYNPSDNSINLMAAFCRGGVYSSDMSIEEKFAKVGFVVGHEISHAFDSSGAQFDEHGAYASWWQEQDFEEFNVRVQRLAEYLDGISLWEGENINGIIKTGEAGADMASMQCLLSLAAQYPEFDYDRFFRSYAELWCAKDNLYVLQVIQTDEHPQDYLRINTTVQQFDEFMDTYGITEGDAMYLAPEARVLIWK